MSMMPEIDFDKAAADAQKAFHVPLGFASPLWFTYSAAAGLGAAYWWMSQWMKSTNMEALMDMMEGYHLAPVPELPFGEAAAVTNEMATAGLSKVEAEAADAFEASVPEPGLLAAALEPEIEAVRVIGAAAPRLVAAAEDDLTRLSGVGPTLAAKLSDMGVKTFADIAAWTDEDLEHYDKSLKLLGRASRDNWIGQARQLADQSPATAH